MRILNMVLLMKITTNKLSLYKGCRVYFPELKRPGCDVNHPPPSSIEVKEREQL